MKNFNNISLKKKIIITFCLILISNAVVTSMTYYRFTSRNTLDNYQKNTADTVRQIEIHLGDKIQDLTQEITALGNNLSFASPMERFLSDSSRMTDPILSGDVAGIISEIESRDDFIDSMYIYTEKKIFDDYLFIRKKDVRFTDTIMYQYMQEHPNEMVAWFPAMKNPLYEDADETIPVVYRKRLGNHELYFVIHISQRAIQDYMEQAYSTFDSIFLVDKDGNNILNYCSDLGAGVLKEFEAYQGAVDGNVCLQLEVDGEPYLVSTSMIKESGWQVYALRSITSMTEGFRQLRLFLIIENIIVILVCLMIVLWIAKRLTSSLEQLAHKMSSAVKEGYHTEYEYPYRDEVGTLAESYNHMIGEIRQHIQALEEEKDHVKEIQRQKRKMELLALQSQINPHFLYNTLNMITWQAVDMNAEEISVISSALGKYFRISLSKGREIITVREEVEHVRSYLEIQKIRYETQLNYEIDIPEDISSCQIIKLVLQPLVENALYHGIKVKEEGGTIWIRAEVKTDRIEFVVEDDGAGIEPERLELLNTRLKNGIVDHETGYGIYNVNSRLRLYYGEHYGLRLEKGEVRGLKSILFIPVTRVEEDVSV